METKLKINGMHCQSCVTLVSDVLKETEGVKDAKVTMGEARVAFDEKKIKLASIKSELKKLGYEVTA